MHHQTRLRRRWEFRRHLIFELQSGTILATISIILAESMTHGLVCGESFVHMRSHKGI